MTCLLWRGEIALLPWLAAAAAEIDTMRKGRKVLIVAENLTQPQSQCRLVIRTYVLQ